MNNVFFLDHNGAPIWGTPQQPLSMLDAASGRAISDANHPNVEDWRGWHGDPSDLGTIQSAAAQSLGLSFPFNKTYTLDGGIKIDNYAAWRGLGGPGNTFDNSINGAPKLYFVGSHAGTSCISQVDPTTNLLHCSIDGISIVGATAATYDWFIDVRHPVGFRLSNLRCETQGTGFGGIHTQKLDTRASWVNNWTQVEVRLPREAMFRNLDCDFSDSAILGGNFTGGLGAILRGTGSVKLIGGRYDITNSDPSAANITIARDVNSSTQYFFIIGCQIEEAHNYGIHLDADAYDPGTPDPNVHPPYMLAMIIGCSFRNSPAVADIKLTNTTGEVMQGPIIGLNSHTLPEHVLYVQKHISYDPTRWTGINIMPSLHRDKAGVNFNIGSGQSGQPPISAPGWTSVTQVPLTLASGTINADQSLATVTIPGGLLAAGDILEIESDWTCTSSANTRIVRVSYGGTLFGGLTVPSTNSYARVITRIRILTTTTQKSQPTNYSGSGQANAAIAPGTIDTTVDQVVKFSVQGNTSGESINLEGFSIKLLRNPI